MQIITLISTSTALVRFRAWLVAAVIFLLVTNTVGAAPIYSTTGSSGYRVSGACVVCQYGINNPERASDATSLNDFATIHNTLGTASSLGLSLKLAGVGQQGDRAGVVVAPGASLVGVSAIGTYRINTYRKNVSVESHIVAASVVQNLQLLASQGRPMQLEFIAGGEFDEVELVVSDGVSVLYSLNVYYAYAVQSLVRQPVRGLVSRFNAADPTQYYSTAIDPIDPLVSVCANANVSNPERAVDTNLNNFATFGTFLGVNCPSSLSVKLENPKGAPAGYYAGFVLGSAGLLDLNVLSRLRITTYNTVNGVRTKQESAVDPSLLDLKLLPDGRYQVSFPTTKEFDEVKIEQLSTVAALDNLQIYYGFGVEPSAFQGTTRILSDFTAPVAANYSVNTTGVLCANCGVSNPAGAADNNPATNATIRLDAGVIAQAELKLALNGATAGNVGVAGYRAGMVISSNTGLLDASILDRLTLTTYDAAGIMLESATGSSLLSLSMLPGGKQEITFLTTRNFASVQISAASLVALGVDINVFQAFADNLAGGNITNIIPLPVELTSFTGRWAGGAAELNWATATEKNSSHFVVERSVGGAASFRAVGQVEAACTSSSPKTYQLRDAEAGTLGVPTLYYRLRQVDKDGTQVFSPLISVAVGKLVLAGPQLEVYPNPAPESRTVLVHCPGLPATGGTVQTYSEMGQLVSQQAITETTTRLSLPALTPGLYHVVLRDATGQQLATQRLVVGGR